MKKKTLEKIVRRLLILPLHHIDTSILLESEKTDDGKICRKYLQKVGYNYKGKLAFPSLSELFVTLLCLPSYDDKIDLFNAIDRTVIVRKIEFYSPKDISSVMEKIKEIDKRIAPVDREVLACAIEDKASTLVTLDKDLIHNEKVEKEFNIKIRHPAELL